MRFRFLTSVTTLSMTFSTPFAGTRCVDRRDTESDVVNNPNLSIIGYYVHHHGGGHAARFDKIREESEHPMVALSELDIPGGIKLGSDVPVTARDPRAGGALHWAPVGTATATRRALQIVEWLNRAQPVGVVCDVSVETALLCRLAGTPTVVVRQHGDRSDDPHRMAYQSAERLIAPWPPELEHPGTPRWVLDKTDHVGFVQASRRSDRSKHERPRADDVVVLWGRGGGTLDRSHLESIADAIRPGRVWTIGVGVEASGPDVIEAGWVDDVATMLTNRPVVVASAGNNVVADAASAGCPLVVVAQDRPFDEQRRHAESLDRAGAAALAPVTADRSSWVVAFDRARDRAATLTELAAFGGARRAAEAIQSALVWKGA